MTATAASNATKIDSVGQRVDSINTQLEEFLRRFGGGFGTSAPAPAPTATRSSSSTGTILLIVGGGLALFALLKR